jgi:hypothetical protein
MGSKKARPYMKQSSAPRGWKKLHDLAQNESDPKKLATLIERLNSVLDHHEKMLANPAHKTAKGEKRAGKKEIRPAA